MKLSGHTHYTPPPFQSYRSRHERTSWRLSRLKELPIERGVRFSWGRGPVEEGVAVIWP